MLHHPRALHSVFYLNATNVVVAAKGSRGLEHVLLKGAELIDALRALTDEEVTLLANALKEAQDNELGEAAKEWRQQ